MALTILQGLKKVKHLDRKIKKNQKRIVRWASYIDPLEHPPQYDVRILLQSINDMLTERAQLRHALHATNAMHKITYKNREITIDDLLIMITVTIPESIKTLKMLRRKEKPFELRDNKEQKVVLQYDPNDRDKKIDALENELDVINELLDELNITVDLFQYV